MYKQFLNDPVSTFEDASLELNNPHDMKYFVEFLGQYCESLEKHIIELRCWMKTQMPKDGPSLYCMHCELYQSSLE